MELTLRPSELKIGDLLAEDAAGPHGQVSTGLVLAVYSQGKERIAVCYDVDGHEEKALYWENDKLVIWRVT